MKYLPLSFITYDLYGLHTPREKESRSGPEPKSSESSDLLPLAASEHCMMIFKPVHNGAYYQYGHDDADDTGADEVEDKNGHDDNNNSNNNDDDDDGGGQWSC